MCAPFVSHLLPGNADLVKVGILIDRQLVVQAVLFDLVRLEYLPGQPESLLVSVREKLSDPL